LPTNGTVWFHLLRHVASSLLSSEDVATPKIDKWTGHQVSGIAGKYIKIHDADMEKIAGTMQRILRPVFKKG
jgi:integrase